MVGVKSRFWNLDRTIRSYREKLEPFRFTICLGWRTVPCKKSMKLCEPQSNHPVLWTVTGSHGSCVSSLKRHHWTLFSISFSYTASFGLMGIRVPQKETLKPSPHSLKSQSLSTSPSLFTLISHLYLSPSSPSATTLCTLSHSLKHSLPLSHSASSPSATMSYPDCSSLSQSLASSLTLYLIAIGHHELPKSQLTLLITLCLVAIAPSPTLCHFSTSTHFDSALARYFILFNSSFFYVNLYFLANLLCKIICDQFCYMIIACESIYMFVFVNMYIAICGLSTMYLDIWGDGFVVKNWWISEIVWSCEFVILWLYDSMYISLLIWLVV